MPKVNKNQNGGAAYEYFSDHYLAFLINNYLSFFSVLYASSLK